MKDVNIATIIKERRSIKRFKSDPISKETLLELLIIAAWALRITRTMAFYPIYGRGT